MREILLSIAGGMGLLIFAFLLFSNGNAAIGLTNALGGQVNQGVKTLQGR